MKTTSRLSFKDDLYIYFWSNPHILVQSTYAREEMYSQDERKEKMVLKFVGELIYPRPVAM
jgi:hypothetical protein